MKFGLGTKLTASFTLLIIMLIVVIVSGIRQINTMSREYESVANLADKIKENMLTIRGNFYWQQSRVRGYIIAKDETTRQNFDATKAEITKLSDELDKLIDSTPDDARPQYIEKINKVKEARQDFIDYALNTFDSVDQGASADELQSVILDTERPIIDNLNKQVQDFIDFVNERSEVRMKGAIEQKEKAIQTQIIFLVVSVIFAFGVALMLTRSTVTPVVSLTAAALAIASGDLTKEIPAFRSKDEIGVLTGAFGQMAMNLRNLVRQVSESAEVLAASSEELSASADQAAQATAQVAQTISQIAVGAQQEVNAVSETSQSFEMTAGDISTTRSLISQVGQMADTNSVYGRNGGQAVESVIKGMAHVGSEVGDAMNTVQGLVQKSDQIEEVVDLISEIAEQTNLLALNAAIESARAGEHGRGFAVVAEEVRKLAEKAGHSTKEIASLISSVRKDIADTVNAIENGREAVRNTTALADDAGTALQETVRTAEQMAEEIVRIAGATDSIEASANKVRMAIQTIAAVTEETSASSEEVSATAEEQSATIEEISSSARNLTVLAQDLTAIVSQFKL